MGVSAGETAHPDLNAILHGGDKFLDRVKQLADQRNAIEGMLKDLALGRDARAALDDAKRKQAAAARVLADAELRAGNMVNDATERSAKMLKDANERSEKMTGEAGAAKKEADALVADARAKNLAATAREKEAVRLRDQHESALAGAKTAQAKFHGLVAELQAVMKKA